MVSSDDVSLSRTRNVPMVRKNKEVFVSLVRRDREPTCEISRCPLVPKDLEDLGRI